MGQENPGPRWQMNWLKPGLLWNKQPIKPAEIGDGLCKIMMTPKNMLEDANYNKILPNHYVIELSQENYSLRYEPLRTSLIQQWHDRLVEHLMTANSRLGRKEYRFGGQVQIELRAASDVKEQHARVLCRVEPTAGDAVGRAAPRGKDRGKETAFLEMLSGSRRWPLYPGDNTIGRDASCDIFLDSPLIQEKRLVSGQHAVIRVAGTECFLYDGALSGKPSSNGTFVNSQRVPVHGAPLRDGDTIILAAIDPHSPRLDTPGVAAFRFRAASAYSN